MAAHPRPDDEERRVALLSGDVKEEWQVVASSSSGEGDDGKLGPRVWEESRKLWVIVAPAIFSRVVTYGMNVITQAFAGHLGDLELAAISIANTVVVGFNFGLMVRARTPAPLLLRSLIHRRLKESSVIGWFVAIFSGSAAAHSDS
jgi:multidrug resistance protein, MATE family